MLMKKPYLQKISLTQTALISARSNFEVRLMNAPHPGEGYVQIKVNETWGSICTHSNLIR